MIALLAHQKEKTKRVYELLINWPRLFSGEFAKGVRFSLRRLKKKFSTCPDIIVFYTIGSDLIYQQS